MNLNDSSLLLMYLSLVSLLGVVMLRVLNSSKRTQEWLFKSILLGLGIVPVIVIGGDVLTQFERISLWSDNWAIIELGLFSGLSWSVAATWLMSSGLQPSASLPVAIRWLRVLLAYMALVVALLLTNWLNLDYHLGLITVVGLASIALGASRPTLLVKSALSGLGFCLLAAVIGYAATYTSPALIEHIFPIMGLHLTVSFADLALVGVLGTSAPLVSRWWFGQPLR